MKPLLLSSVLLLGACGGSAPEATPPAVPSTEATAPAAPARGAAVTDAAPGDVGHGKEIAGSKCSSCHGTEVFTRADRKVTSPEGLDAQVDQCGGAVALSESDKTDVKSYLAHEFYSFE